MVVCKKGSVFPAFRRLHKLTKMKNYLTIFFFASLFFFACKDADDEQYSPRYANFSNLKVGNYWVYERYKLDSNGVYTALGKFDSTFVEKDTLINGLTYSKYMDDQFATGPGFEATFLRDSLHYLVELNGRIRFSSENFSDTLFQFYSTTGPHAGTDTLCLIYRKMTDNDLPVTTPAGTFVSKNAQEVYVMFPGFDQGGKVRPLQRRYAEDVGLIEETLPFFISDVSKSYTVRRLVRYGKN